MFAEPKGRRWKEGIEKERGRSTYLGRQRNRQASPPVVYAYLHLGYKKGVEVGSFLRRSHPCKEPGMLF